MAGDILSADIVDACHMLPGKSSEEMRHRDPHPEVHVTVFKHVADVFDAVRAAPLPQLGREAFGDQSGNHFHIGIADFCLFVLICGVCPEIGNTADPVLRTIFFCQKIPRGPGPGQVLSCRTNRTDRRIAFGISDRRFIREESENGIAEIRFIALIMRFINRIDENPAGFFVKEIDVVIPAARIPGQIHDVYSEISFR